MFASIVTRFGGNELQANSENSLEAPSTQVSTASVSDNTVYAFMVENPEMVLMCSSGLRAIHEDDMEAMGSDNDKSKVGCVTMSYSWDTLQGVQSLRSKETSFDWSDMGRRTIPPPYPLIYNRPNKLNMSYSGHDEFKEPEFKGYGPKNNKKVSNVVKESDNSKENSNKSLVKEQESSASSTNDDKGFMCDKKNYVLFTDTECLVLSPNFKLPDENQILLKVPRKDNMYSFDMKNIVPKESLTCLVAKATLDESMLGQKIGWIQHRASCKSKVLNPITKPLFMLHMDLFGPTFVSSLMHKKYCLVVTDDYSRFTWVFFLTTKDETSEILKSFIKEIENLVDKKVKIIRSDNGTEFKNKVMDDFCREKGIKREYSVARTPQQNGVAERRNRTLIEAARTITEEEPEVDLGNITNSYIVPTTPNTRIHKDHPTDNVIGDVQFEPTSIANALSDFILGEGNEEELLQFKLQQVVWILEDLLMERWPLEPKWAENYYCQANVNAVKMTWAPKLQLFSNSYHLRHCLRGGISQEVGTPRYLSLVVPLAVHKELGDRMERAATTASSLEAEQDSGSGPRCQDTILGDVNAQTRFEITSIQSIDPPLSRGYTLGSGEDSMKLIGIDKILLKLVLSVLVSAVKRMLMLPVQVSVVRFKLVLSVLVSAVKRMLMLPVQVSAVEGNCQGTDCLPTAIIFEELARMGYEKPSQKLTFYKSFFSPQWKYYIHTITQCLSAKSTAWNEFSSSMSSLIICLATNQKFNLSMYIFDAMVKHLDGGVKFLLYPRFLQVFINQQLGNMSTHKKIVDPTP
ncbi:putative ribonuclease H-like domain-containing protein [Tanacetum coccineum]